MTRSNSHCEQALTLLSEANRCRYGAFFAPPRLAAELHRRANELMARVVAMLGGE